MLCILSRDILLLLFYGNSADYTAIRSVTANYTAPENSSRLSLSQGRRGSKAAVFAAASEGRAAVITTRPPSPRADISGQNVQEFDLRQPNQGHICTAGPRRPHRAARRVERATKARSSDKSQAWHQPRQQRSWQHAARRRRVGRVSVTPRPAQPKRGAEQGERLGTAERLRLCRQHELQPGAVGSRLSPSPVRNARRGGRYGRNILVGILLPALVQSALGPPCAG